MQGITSKILENHFLFWPWPLPPVEKKKRKACRNFVQESGASDQYLQNTACTNFAREKYKSRQQADCKTCQNMVN